MAGRQGDDRRETNERSFSMQSAQLSRGRGRNTGGTPVQLEGGKTRAGRPRHYRRGGPPTFLPNEAICNVEETASILFGENGLCRLQKNDKWLRFFVLGVYRASLRIRGAS